MIDLEDYKRDLKAGKYDNYEELYEDMVEQSHDVFKGLREANERADWRLELLNDYNEGLQYDPDCFSCGIMVFDESTERWIHNTGCELAKELGDD